MDTANPPVSNKDGSSKVASATNALTKNTSSTMPPVSNEATVTPIAPVHSKTSTSTTVPSTSLGNTSNLAPASNNLSTTANVETDEEAIRNQKLVEEFQYLLEKSQSLFSGLRDLPPTGSHRQWRPYFEKTFEVYTKLWKFQQTHRSILENKSNYGLKRWEVGEIASKIGQLYYHYYLRTSETNYLHEAYVFYEAIHERQYFKDILEVKNSALMIKKMRYYARFIIVCFLLNKDENVRQLIAELEGLIEEYAKTFKPADAKEWQMVLEEIVTFTEAEKRLVPINLDRTPGKIEHRLPAVVPERNIGAGTPKLRLQEAILVGNYDKQIKFSELTLDMYRMLQSLEREPSTSLPSTSTSTVKADAAPIDKKDTSTANKEDTSSNTAKAASTSSNAANPSATTEKAVRRPNPHKYLLYRPSFSQLMVYISTAFKDTNDNSAMFLYLSADGYSNNTEQVIPGYRGGVLTSARHSSNKGSTAAERAAANNATSNQPSTATGGIGNPAAINSSNNASGATSNTITTASTNTNNSNSTQNNNGSGASTTGSINNSAATATATTMGTGPGTEQQTNPPSTHCLHPADLIPFTRKPLFLIVDSEKSNEFRNMPNVFDQPVMCLMSPVEYPSSVQDKCEIGSLFTLFLHTPVLGFCSISDIGNLDQQKWDDCVKKIAAMEKTIGNLLLLDNNVDKNVKRFLSDDFLYYFIVRFVLCGVFLRYHSSFKDEKSFPSSLPHLPETIYVSTEIVTMLAELTAIADVGTYFSLPAYATASVAANAAQGQSPLASASVSSNTNNVVERPVGMSSSPPANAPTPMDINQ